MFGLTYLVSMLYEVVIGELQGKVDLGNSGHVQRGNGQVQQLQQRRVNYSLNYNLKQYPTLICHYSQFSLYTKVRLNQLHSKLNCSQTKSKLKLNKILYIHPSFQMQYRQNAKLNSNQKKTPDRKGFQVEEIVFDKEITQSWKVDTDEPTEILPYAMKKIYLSTICDFWHQIKFFYHQNYDEVSRNENKNTTGQVQVQQIESYSSVQIVHSAQVIQNCKRISKVIWKIMRHRLIKAFNSIKEQAGIEQDQSLQLQDDKLASYMIFLKLQQNSRIDLAIQTCDSVVQKNTRRKLLDAFLNMKQNLKLRIKRQTYHDRIKLQCFTQIIMRNVKKLNIDHIVDSFTQLFEFSQWVKREQQYKQLENRKKQQSVVNNAHYRSISNRKVINDLNQSQTMQNLDTVSKHQQKTHKQPHSPRHNQNHISTVKRQTLNQKQILQNSNINSITSEYISNIKSSHQKIIHSHYYYQDQDHKHNSNQKHSQQPHHYHRHNNMNSLPTRRQTRSSKNYKHQQRNQYLISGVENNINSQTLYPPQKTVRTPSRSDVNKNSLLSTHSYQHHQSHHKSTHEDLHIPITQRIDKHYHQDHYEEVLEEQNSHLHHQDSQQNIHQQICVIRNFSTTPTRKPDRYEKIPILSSNIQFRQFFLNSNSKKPHPKTQSHSNSFYEKQICSDCQYCTKIAKMKQMVEHIAKQRNNIHSEKIIIENVTIRNEIITETVFEKDNFTGNQVEVNQKQKNPQVTQRVTRDSKREFGSMHLDIDKINESSNSRISINKVEKVGSNLKEQVLGDSLERKYRREHSPNSPLLTPGGQTLHTPSSQVSAFTQGADSRRLSSERKIFKRKPLNGK